jgi:hypothetical protein
VDERNAPHVLRKLDYIITSKPDKGKLDVKVLAEKLKISPEVLSGLITTNQD